MWWYKVTTAFCLRPCYPTFRQYQLIHIFGGGFLINAAFYVAVGMMTVQNKKKNKFGNFFEFQIFQELYLKNFQELKWSWTENVLIPFLVRNISGG